MEKPAIPDNELERLAALHRLALLDTPPEERFDRIVRVAASLFKVPIAYIALIDSNRQWFKSACGLSVLQTDRDVSFCGHAILSDEPLIVTDSHRDPRFADNPMVTGDPFVRFYAGYPLSNPDGLNVGTLCLVDRQPRSLSPTELELFRDLASAAKDQLTITATVELQDQLLASKRALAEVNQELKARNDFIRQTYGERTEVVLDMMRAFNSVLERDLLLPLIMEKITRAMKADRSTLFLWDKKRDELFSRIAQGNDIKEIRFPASRGIAGHVVTSGEIVNIRDAYEDPRFNRSVDQETGYRTKTILCIPIRNTAGDILGAVQVLNKKDDVFGDDDEELLGALASQAAVALDNSNLFEEVRAVKNYNESILRDMATGVITLDAEGSVVTINEAAEKIFGLRRETSLGLHYRNVLHESLNADLVNNLAEGMSSNKRYFGYDIKFRLPDDEDPISFNLSAVALSNGRGEAIGHVLVIDDITQEQRLMSTFSRYVDRAVAEEMIYNRHLVKLGGVRVELPILFCDIRGFTTLSEGVEAEDIVELLNDYFSRVTDVIFAHGGTLDKFIGDAVMAVFGTPIRHEDDPLRAVRAALDIRKQLQAFNRERREKGLFEIENGVGIAYGQVVSGNIGSQQRMDYTVIGDAVNVSSRLEGLTRDFPQKIIINEALRERVKDHVACHLLDTLHVKGRHQEVRVYGIADDATVRT